MAAGFFAAFFAAGFFAAFLAAGFLAAGFFAAAFFAGAFFATFFAAGFFAAAFFAAGFFAATFLAGAFFAGAFFAGAFLAATFFAGAFLAGAFFAATFFAGAFLAATFFAGAFFGAAFLAAVFFAVAIVFSLITLQRSLHVWSTRSDSRRWAVGEPGPAPRTREQSPTRALLRCGHWSMQVWKSLWCRFVCQSQERAPPDWYSITRVSKKLRSFFRSIISLIQGNGFSSFGNSVSKPICVARRLAM